MKSDPNINRREFLIRSAKAGVCAISASAIAYQAYDPKGPTESQIRQQNIVLPDFSIADQKGKLAIVHGKDRIETIRAAFHALGGIGNFIKAGDRVLLKVNAAFASPPALSATTNPQLISEVASLCRKAGASQVLVSDNPINDPASCFRLTGIEEAAAAAGAKLILPKESLFQPITLAGGKLIRNWPLLYEPLKHIHKLIGIAPLKDHHRSGASMSMKNWYGLLGGRRNIFHQDIHGIITELAMMVRPTLVILDGTTSMMTNGPTGGSLSDLKETNTMIVSTDQVAADAFGATLLERKIQELPYIAKAQSAGAGTSDYESLKPIRLN